MFYRLYWPIAAVDVRLCSLDPLHKRKTTGREKEKWTDFDVADTQPFVELGILGPGLSVSLCYIFVFKIVSCHLFERSGPFLV